MGARPKQRHAFEVQQARAPGALVFALAPCLRCFEGDVLQLLERLLGTRHVQPALCTGEALLFRRLEPPEQHLQQLVDPLRLAVLGKRHVERTQLLDRRGLVTGLCEGSAERQPHVEAAPRAAAALAQQ